MNEDICFHKYSEGLNDGAVHKLSILCFCISDRDAMFSMLHGNKKSVCAAAEKKMHSLSPRNFRYIQQIILMFHSKRIGY